MYKLIKIITSKKVLYYLLSFFIPILIILIHILSQSIIHRDYFQNGENFLVADASKQYISIYAYIWDVLHAKASIFYSFGKGVGGNMLGTVGYYASSPLNILYILVPKSNIAVINFVNYLLKIGFASLFMRIYLKNKFKNETRCFIFAIIYSLIAYNVNYYFHSMWLDVMVLTPLVVLGIDKIIDDNRIWLYTVILSVSIMINFYISYMLCIFCVIYFIYGLLLKYKIKDIKEYKKTVFKFIIASLLAGGMSAFWSLPIFYDLQGINHGASLIVNTTFRYNGLARIIVHSILGRLFLGSYNVSSIMQFYPSIYSGLLPLVLSVLYFFNPKISIKEKVLSVVVFLFFWMSFVSPKLSLFWHAGFYPNCYVSRFSFMYSFFVILISIKSLIEIKHLRLIYIVLCFLIFLLVFFKVMVQYLIYINMSSLLISLGFIVSYLTILGLMIVLKDKRQKVLNLILILLVIIELFINFKICFVTKTEWNMTGQYKDYYQNICTKIEELDDSFYRIDGTYKFSYLDQLICQKSSVSISLSTTQKHFYDFWKQNGGAETFLDIWNKSDLPILNSILGVKYFINNYDKESVYDNDYYEKIKSMKIVDYNIANNKKYNLKVDIYKNPYALSMGYLIPSNYDQIYANIPVTNSIEALNRLMKTLSGNDEDVLIMYNRKILDKNKYNFDIDSNDKYFYFSSEYNVFQVMMPEISVEQLTINNKNVITATIGNLSSVKVKNKYSNNSIDVKLEKTPYNNTIDGSLIAYHIDKKVFEHDIKQMKKHQLTNVKVEGNKVTGTINADREAVLFTSIPYEKGWHIYVDGKKVKYEKVIDEFIGFRVSKGKHNIKMVFYPPYMGMGILISVISIIILVIYEMFSMRKKKYLH